MDYSYSHKHINQYHKQIGSPTTAQSKRSSKFHVSSVYNDQLRSDINHIIKEVDHKRNQNQTMLSNVYKVNEQALGVLNPNRSLRVENQQLRAELNEALSQIIRMRQEIIRLENENYDLKNSFSRSYSSKDLLQGLSQLKSEGQNLRYNVISMLRNR